MKKFKGQGTVQIVTGTAAVAVISIASIYMLGGSLSGVVENNNPAQVFNAGRTAKHVNPQDLVSNVKITLNGGPIESPVEEVVKENLLNGSYVQTSGSSGREKEVVQIMKRYTDDLLSFSMYFNTGAPYLAYKNALIQYKNVLDSILVDLANPNSLFLRKRAILNVAIKLNKNECLAKNLKNALTAYLASLPASDKSSALIKMSTEDLLDFGSNLTYSLDDSLYTTYLGEAKQNSVSQDKRLLDIFYLPQYSNLADAQADTMFNQYINIFYTSDYTVDAAGTYNSKALCTSLGGSGNPCNL